MKAKDNNEMIGAEKKMDKRTTQTIVTLMWSIATALSLAIMKFIAGLLTHSMAIMASALDSFMDVGVSTVNLIAAREAAKPPDEDHAYGHGKIESLAGLFQSALVGLSGLYLVFESIRRLVTGSFVNSIPAGIIVMIISMVLSWFLIKRIESAVKENKSLILATERLHFTTDILTNGGVILALVLISWTRFVFWDLIVSILVALYIFKLSIRIFRHSIDELLDRSLSPVSKIDIEKMIHSHHPAIVGLHNFRSHRVGERIFLDFHIEIRGEEDFKRAHNITESLIEEIKTHYPGADVTVHYDPEGEK